MPVLNIESLDDVPQWDAMPSFEGGQFSNSRANLLKANQCSLIENMDLSISGQMTTRRGTKQLGAYFNEVIQGVNHYLTPTIDQLIAVAGKVLRLFNGTTWTLPGGYHFVANNNPVTLVNGNDGNVGPVMFIGQEGAALSYWDGTNITVYSDAAVAEVTKVVNGSGTVPVKTFDQLKGKYFILSDDAGTVGVWFNSASVPLDVPSVIPAPNRWIEVPVNDSSDVDTTAIMTALVSAINADAQAKFTSVLTSAPSAVAYDTVTITATPAGARDDSEDADSGLIVTTVTQGSSGNARPPSSMDLLVWHTERLIGSGVSTAPDTIYFSQFLDGGTWDQVNKSIRVGASDGEPITGIASWTNYNLIVLKNHSIWVVGCDPNLEPAFFQINRIHDRIGSLSPRTVCQVGTDIFFLSDKNRVHSIKNIIASEQQKEIGEGLSFPVDDILNRVNNAAIGTATAFHWEKRYILAVPIDGAVTPNYVLVYNTETETWDGAWTGWSPLYFTHRVDNGTPKMCFAQADTSIVDWMDYIKLSQETRVAFQDKGDGLDVGNYPSEVLTRAFSWNEPACPKTGSNVEFEFTKSKADVTIEVVRDDSEPEMFEEFSTLQNSLYLPLTLPFTLPKAGTVRKAFDLQRYDPFRELQFKVTATEGKLVLRSIAASAFIDTVELETA